MGVRGAPTDETGAAAYLRLLALRLLTGLRSADGACVPRCLLRPSPGLGKTVSSSPTSSSFSSSHGCTSAAFTLPDVLIPVGSSEPACFGLPSSAPASTPLSLLLPIQCSRGFPQLQLAVETRASALASPRGGPASGGSAAGSFPML